MHICRLTASFSFFFLDKHLIPLVEEAKFLVVVFDRKSSFVLHLKYVRKKDLKTIIFYTLLAILNGGADQRSRSAFIDI